MKQFPLPSAAPAQDPAFQAIKQRIIDRTGHAYYDDKDPALWERIRRRLTATGRATCAEYMTLLDHQDQLMAAAEWQALESEITIGETFFFRYIDQFHALRQTILPDILARNRSSRRIRIWSAGCSTGAEPYSVAIVLRELMGPEVDEWSVRIIATDINEAFLEIARSGHYGGWALRAVTPEQRARYFTPEPGSGRVALKPEFRGMVMFQQHNLMSLLDDTSPLQFSDFDLILCRNVLIYFRMNDAIRIMTELAARLSVNGWLLAGTADPGPVLAGAIRYVPLPGTAAYRRLAEDVRAQAAAPRIETIMGGDPRPRPHGRTAAPAGSRTRAQPSRTRPTPFPGRTEPAMVATGTQTDLIERIRVLSGLGELDEARACCRTAIEADPINPVIYFYEGLIALALAEDADAARAFGKALYLDRQFVMAHYQLGVLHMRNGQAAAGTRHVKNAIRLSRTLADDEPVPEGGGMTAAEFRSGAMLYLEASGRRR
ncbi:CheR family methyltransferase [Rhodoligotrophos defluvii]|uniref:CheR family methyltransferase n=1 Tax=Rhodoligotrophos defluvii TaxID=2561934 RepID=UPI0010C98172|nr:protein-glutamate O-methyltransferase CheR [Rhodoligotrophos defluvii]